jgi:hypothetical protein
MDMTTFVTVFILCMFVSLTLTYLIKRVRERMILHQQIQNGEVEVMPKEPPLLFQVVLDVGEGKGGGGRDFGKGKEAAGIVGGRLYPPPSLQANKMNANNSETQSPSTGRRRWFFWGRSSRMDQQHEGRQQQHDSPNHRNTNEKDKNTDKASKTLASNSAVKAAQRHDILRTVTCDDADGNGGRRPKLYLVIARNT